ncbi:peroxidase-like [Mya arenaria]|uniref:peroxidase-like n=1 Tax=Mya arenaria TaxID=6604 RepID=UPI0022E1F9D1|nr:peroxidase-like [Mya arenaria]
MERNQPKVWSTSKSPNHTCSENAQYNRGTSHTRQFTWTSAFARRNGKYKVQMFDEQSAEKVRYCHKKCCLIFCMLSTIVSITLILLLCLVWLADTRNDVIPVDDVQRLTALRLQVENRVTQWNADMYQNEDDSGGQTTDVLTSIAHRAYVMQEIVREIVAMKNSSFSDITGNQEANTLFRSVAGDLCDPDVTCSNDIITSPYRTIDGSCNNLDHTDWGMAWTPQRREIPPDYHNVIGAPRQYSKSTVHRDLPSPRLVSNTVHRARTDRRTDNTSTIMVMAFGQFLSHDLSITPEMKGPKSRPFKCCRNGHRAALSGPFDSCLPITIPESDMYFRSGDCMEFVRSAAAVCPNCRICGREQLNGMTSYIDASQVYAETTQGCRKLRNSTGGRLSVSGNKDLLPYAANDTCRLSVYGQHCFAAGDSRVNVVPNLSSHHIMFVRLHNQLADRLAGINPAWDDERLFQESRKLVIGIIQQFAYAEYLPAVLGNDIMERYRLNVQADGGHARVYDASIDATVFNAFNAAAFRFGHTTVPDLQESLKKSYASEYKTSIETTYNDPNMTYHHCDGVVRWITHSPALPTDGNFGVGIRDKLFPDAHNVSTDLAARNIQRGRDHGLPPYNRWRRHCGLSEITLGEFQAAGAVMGDFDVDTADSIRSVYEHPDDIDLFTGAIKERHLAKAQVGPLFACLLGTQFKRLKYGDRFYFENPSPAGGPDTGFSLEQLKSIRKLRLSKVLCQTMNTPRIQPDVFKPPSEWNPLVACESLPDIDLEPWLSL